MTNKCKCGHRESEHFVKDGGTLFGDLKRANKEDYSHGCDRVGCDCKKFVEVSDGGQKDGE